MDSAFLILVAIPLGVYLVALVFSTRGTLGEISPEDAAHAERQAAEALAAVEAEAQSVYAQEQALELAHEFNAAAAPSQTTGTISDKPISSKVVPASERVGALGSETDARVETISPTAVEPETTTTVASALDEPSAEAAITVDAEPISAPAATTESAVGTSESESTMLAAVAKATTEISASASATPATVQVTEPLETEALEPEEEDPILPEGPIQLPDKGSPKYAFDYRGRLWVEKKNKGFFRQLRRPQLPPEDPNNGR